MSHWIPTSERLPDNRTNSVWVTNDSGNVYLVPWKSVSTKDQAWKPIEKPEPYVPPKPKRFEVEMTGHVALDSMQVSWHHKKLMREVLPGDPDPDTVLDVLEGMKLVLKSMPQLTCISTWIKQLKESRSK